MTKDELAEILKDCIRLIVELLTHYFGYTSKGEIRDLKDLTYMNKNKGKDENLDKFMKDTRVRTLKGTKATDNPHRDRLVNNLLSFSTNDFSTGTRTLLNHSKEATLNDQLTRSDFR